MFSDLNNQSLNKIPTSKAKAYPSVNSPNEGGFNSEENLRWLTKAIANKPFIIGQTDDDVNRSFGENETTWDGSTLMPGFFSIDGYIGKIADQTNISFDNESTDSVISVNTQLAQRFVQDMTNTGTANAMETDIGKILFSEYNPTATGAVPNTIKAAWQSAYENHTCVGYAWNTYSGTYITDPKALVIFTSSSYNSVYHKFEDGKSRSATTLSQQPPDDNYIGWVETLISNNTIKAGDMFSTVITPNTITVFYPIFFENRYTWDSRQRKYVKSVKLSFTDLFSLNFDFGQEYSNSHAYPDTLCTLFDMNGISGSNPLRSIPFNNYKVSTYPSNLYDFTKLYDDITGNVTLSGFDFDIVGNMYNRKTSYTDTDYMTPAPDTFPSNIKDIKDTDGTTSILTERVFPNDLSNLFPSDDDLVTHVHNNLTYYCLNDDIIQDPLYVDNDSDKRIPVAFMTSEGNLCPDGFIYSASESTNDKPSENPSEPVAISKRYPVEGYLHYAKRHYLQTICEIPNVDEDMIENLSVEEMCTNETYKNEFRDFFNNVFAKPISIYLHMTYCSLVDNVINKSNIPDYMKMKSSGCGTKLYSDAEQHQSISPDENELYTRQSYQGTDPKTSSIYNITISYHNDKTSDYEKYENVVVENTDYSDGLIQYFTAADASKLITMCEDPINYVRRSVYSDLTHNKSSYIINGFNLYMIVKDGSIYKLSRVGGNDGKVTANIYHVMGSDIWRVSPSTLYNVKQVYVDDFLMPVSGTPVPETILVPGTILSTPTDPFVVREKYLYALMDYHYVDSMSTGTNNASLVNGLCVRWKQNTWETKIPFTLSVEKDNLNYLRNIAINDPGYYYGFNYGYEFPYDVSNNDLFIAYVDIGTTLTVSEPDVETSNLVYDVLSKESKHRRESYIHFNKLYGDNYETLDEYILSVVNDMSNEIAELQSEVAFLKDSCVMFWDKCGDNVFYCIYGNGNTILVGSGDTYDYEGRTSPICENLIIKNVEIRNGITSIGNGLFNSCTNIESVDIPNTVTSIGRNAFNMSVINEGARGSLTSITIPSSVTTIKQSAFSGTALTDIIIPSSVTTIDTSAFSDCTNLTSVIYNANILGGSMFQKCTSLISFSIATGLTSIGGNCFRGCSSLQTIVFDGTLSDWGSVTKDTNWDGKGDSPTSGFISALTKVQCTDGYMQWDSENSEWIAVPNA